MEKDNNVLGGSDQIDTIKIEPLDSITLPSIDTIDLNSYSWNTSISSQSSLWSTTANNHYGNITIGPMGSNIGSTLYTTSGSNGTSGLHVTSDASFEGDIKWKGKSLGEMIEKIHDRLAILTPDMEKLEHFSALKKAYDNYKMLEALCEVPKKEEDEQ